MMELVTLNKDKQCYSSEECFRVQMDGTNACKKCPLYETSECGGKSILSTGKNKKGNFVNETGVVDYVLSPAEQKSKKKKKKR